MKGGTVQIAWHGSEPVLSLDFHSVSGLLATAGADHDIKLWSVHQNDNALPTVKFEADLSYHAKAVNVLRFSPSGQLLASGGDGGEILLWRAVENAENKPGWKVLRTLQLHLRDVLDLAWSPDSTFLMSGSVDNQCMIWDVSTGKVRQILNEHLHFVQGVAWDPAGQFLASISADRTCRIYSCQSAPTSKKQKNGLENSLYQCQQVLAKTDLLPSKSNGKTDDSSSLKAAATKQHLFHDETLPSFFRRLSWSPDGSFLVVPSGVHKTSQEAAQCNMSYIMSRRDLSRPAIHLPGPSKPVVAVRFCPIIFSLETDVPEEETSSCGFRLPYRLVFAVATLDSLFIYDTQHNSPIVIFAGLHYAAITDIAWSGDAQYVAVSSQDGYCTLLAFSDDELGVRLPCSEVPPHIASYLPETLLAKGRTGSTTAPTETLLKSQAQASPNSICPRPLKHRRITPTALPVGSSPSPPKNLHITPTAITVSTPPQTDNQHQITPNTLSDSSPSTSGNCQETPASTAPSSPQNNLLNDPCSTSAPSSDNNSHLVVSSPLEASTASAKKRRRIIPTPIPADPASSSLHATSREAPVETLSVPEQCEKVSAMSLSMSLPKPCPLPTASTSAEIPSQKQHCNTLAAVSANQPLTALQSFPSPTKEDHKGPVLPARKQRRITPTAIPSAAPSNTQNSYDVTLASHFEASSSSGVELSAPSGSNRRESGLEFVMELNAVATAK